MSAARKAQITLIILLTIVFTAVLAWIFPRGQTSSPQPPNTPTVTPNMDFVVNIPQKTLWGNYITVSVEAIPETTCKLIYVPPADETHQMDTIANSNGLCEWRWKIEETQGKGDGRLIFTINGISETHFIEIRSAF